MSKRMGKVALNTSLGHLKGDEGSFLDYHSLNRQNNRLDWLLAICNLTGRPNKDAISVLEVNLLRTLASAPGLDNGKLPYQEGCETHHKMKSGVPIQRKCR